MSEMKAGQYVTQETADAVNAIRAKKNVRYWCPVERKGMTGRGGRQSCPDCGAGLMLGGPRGGRRSKKKS